jgi:hypothetical protein
MGMEPMDPSILNNTGLLFIYSHFFDLLGLYPSSKSELKECNILSAWIFTHRASDNILIGTLEAQPIGVDGVTVNLLALPIAKRLHIWSTMRAYDGWNVA